MRTFPSRSTDSVGPIRLGVLGRRELRFSAKIADLTRSAAADFSAGLDQQDEVGEVVGG